MIKYNVGFYRVLIVLFLLFPAETLIIGTLFVLIDYFTYNTTITRVITLVISGLALIIYVILNNFNFNVADIRIETKVMGVISVFVDALTGLYDGGIEGLFKTFIFSYTKVTFLSFAFIAMVVFIISIPFYNRELRLDKRQIRREKFKKSRRIQKSSHKFLTGKEKGVDYDAKGHSFVVGTTGSGKTVNLSHYMNLGLLLEKFLLIIDGKGDMTKYSIYDLTVRLAQKYGRKLYIVNQTNSDKTNDYNPFKNVNPTQLADMLVNMSIWTEEHYKIQAQYFWLTMAQVMKELKIRYSFQNIIKCATREALYDLTISNTSNISDMNLINRVKEIYYNPKAYESVEVSNNRFRVKYYGEGQKIFQSHQGFDMEQAYQENAIVLVLLNKMKYSDFAESLGHLVLDDLKNMIGTRYDNEKEIERESLLILDELAVYIDENTLDIVNKARSAGFKAVLSTQSVTDIDMINNNSGEGLRNSIINNCNNFIVLRQNDSESPEVLASVIGTEKAIEHTRKIEEELIAGMGTKKVVNEFKIHPDDIKELKELEGIFYTKSDPGNVVKFHTSFLEI